jgi:hypothetical protein
MSTKRYLEIDSSYRDRNQYPLPSQFVVSIQQSGEYSENKKTALDPVSDASPVMVWNNSFQELKQGTTNAILPYISGIKVNATGNQTFHISTTVQKLRQVRDFYVGCNLSRDDNGNYPPVPPITNRRITSYLPLNVNNAIVSLESSLPDDLVGLTGFYIADPSTNNIYDLVLFNIILIATANPLVYKVEGDLKNFNGYYIGWRLQYGENVTPGIGAFPPLEPWATVDIVNYEIIPTYPYHQITLSAPITYNLTKYYYFMSSPSFTSIDSARNYLKFFIPISNNNYEDTEQTAYYGTGDNNYYINYGIMRTFDNTFAKISEFDSLTRLATLETPPYTYFLAFGDAASVYQYRWVNWGNQSFNFVLRKTQPAYTDVMSYEYDAKIGIVKAIVYGKSIQLGINYRNIFQYNQLAGYKTDELNYYFLRLSPYIGLNPPYPRPLNEERKILRNIYSVEKFIEVTPEYIILSNNSSSIDNYYKDGIINVFYVIKNPFTGTPIKTQKIKSYIGKERKAIFENPIEIIPYPGPPYEKYYVINTAILTEFFSSPVEFIQPVFYEIEQYSYDNARPFNYTGSLVSNSQSTCYEIELINLIIPNTTLVSGRGSRAIFYPYFYVELKPLSAPSSMSRGIISSNNPYAFKMLFRAIINDISAPLDSPFLKIDGDGMTHTVKFNIHDSFLFSVYHANGELIKTDISEQYSPTEPNSRCQISACFSFQKVD